MSVLFIKIGEEFIHRIPEFFCGHIKSIWGEGRHYRESDGKKRDARRGKKRQRV